MKEVLEQEVQEPMFVMELPEGQGGEHIRYLFPLPRKAPKNGLSVSVKAFNDESIIAHIHQANSGDPGMTIRTAEGIFTTANRANWTKCPKVYLSGECSWPKPDR